MSDEHSVGPVSVNKSDFEPSVGPVSTNESEFELSACPVPSNAFDFDIFVLFQQMSLTVHFLPV